MEEGETDNNIHSLQCTYSAGVHVYTYVGTMHNYTCMYCIYCTHSCTCTCSSLYSKHVVYSNSSEYRVETSIPSPCMAIEH